MYISNLRTEFYDVISGNWVLLLVAYDVDSLCACKILQYLFQCDNVLYTLIPVYGKSSLRDSFRKHKDQAKYVVMINCGATIDIVEFLQPDEDVIFFICDTHRPIDVYNVYSNSQIKLLMKSEDGEDAPSYEDLFRDSDDEDEEQESSRLTEEVILKRREKRLWEENRHKIIFDYTQFSYHGLSSALTMFELAWKMSRDTNDLLWWAIVGLTEQYMFGKIEQEKYILSASSLQNHVARHNHRDANSTTETKSCMKISFDKELNLALYRHWSLFESLMHSKYTACKFKLWTFKGQKKMHEFLAEIGIPLPQCKQRYTAMDAIYRSNISSWMEDMSEKYKLDQIVFGSFISQFGYKGKYCATDVVFAITALLESIDKEKVQTDNFLCALNALSKGQINALQHGIELAKKQLTAIFHQVQTFIDMNHIISVGPFLYAVIQDGTTEVRHFSNPGCLCMLAHFLLQAHACSSRSRKARSLPLVLMAQIEKDLDQYIVIGIPPLSEGSPKNFFGKAFEQAAERSRSQVFHDCFESSIIYIHTNDRSKFFDALIAILS